MKFFFLVASIFFLVVSCSDTSQPTANDQEIIQVIPELIEVDDFNYDTLKGMYTADFGGSQIRIILNYVSQTNAIGYNIHKGLQRNISGKVFKSQDSIYISLAEPGDHEFDGMFNLTFIGVDKSPQGLWVSNSGKIKPKQFELSKVGEQPQDDGEITAGNFANYYGYLYDSMGNYTFEKDGLCIYEYYPTTDDENRVEQLKSIMGTWNLVEDSVTIDWEANDYFDNRRVKYKVLSGDYNEGMLIGEKDTLNSFYF